MDVKITESLLYRYSREAGLNKSGPTWVSDFRLQPPHPQALCPEYREEGSRKAVAPWVGTLLILIGGLLAVDNVQAARFAVFFPLPSDQASVGETNESPLPPQSADLSPAMTTSWQAYCDAWKQHHINPADESVRRRLGIAANELSVVVSNGRAAAVSLRLPSLEMQRYETEHFVLLADTSAERASDEVRKLEQYYLVWTQLFFPLWKDREQWDRTVGNARPKTSIKHRVVLFANAARYAELLRGEGLGMGQSTGFYSDLKRITFLHDGQGEDSASRVHELTHQLMTEATDSKPRSRPGERRDFWLVEGIACYMESTVLHADHANVGGWHASRLQFARHRVLGLGDDLPFASLSSEGRLAVQQRQDLSRWYSFVAAYTHQLIDEGNGSGLVDVIQRLAAIYQIRISAVPNNKSVVSSQPLADYLRIDDDQLLPVDENQLRDLCLTHCAVTVAGITTITPSRTLRWLDLSFLPVDHTAVVRLCPDTGSLEQLSLEATQVDDSVGDWLAGATKLRELDLSSTRIGDDVIGKLPTSAPLTTLWLTGSQVSDASIDRIIAMKSVTQVDLQRTRVTDAGIGRLRSARKDVQINPLEIMEP